MIIQIIFLNMNQQYFNRPHYAEFASDQHLIDHFSHLTILRSGILANWNISQFLALKQKFILFCGHLLTICIVHVKDIEFCRTEFTIWQIGLDFQCL